MYEFGFHPLLGLNDVKTRLPSLEETWQGNSQDNRTQESPPPLTLNEALETLYIEKRSPPGLCEFSVGILIYAICRHTTEMLTARWLACWIPSAISEKRSDTQQPLVSSDWLPSTEVASKWRNSACDSLDILHWRANSKVAKSSGFEHHTILHLHLARIILLAPTACVRTLATELTTTTHSRARHDGASYLSTARKELLQWVSRDRYKCRLAVIHCAALYWHVRRYSCGSMQEPYAIYIATLVLWAFCVSMQMPEVVEADATDGEAVPDPSFCHLDRPMDDELVQLFVRMGHRMCPNISKVGNILDPRAAPKILREGHSLLLAGARSITNTDSTSLQFTWGLEECYATSLNGILEAMPCAETMQAEHGSQIFPWSLCSN